MTRLVLIGCLAALLGACAAHPPAPIGEPACVTEEDRAPVDGGLGGTGHAPPQCPPE